jgi:hypothetical protein
MWLILFLLSTSSVHLEFGNTFLTMRSATHGFLNCTTFPANYNNYLCLFLARKFRRWSSARFPKNLNSIFIVKIGGVVKILAQKYEIYSNTLRFMHDILYADVKSLERFHTHTHFPSSYVRCSGNMSCLCPFYLLLFFLITGQCSFYYHSNYFRSSYGLSI